MPNVSDPLPDINKGFYEGLQALNQGVQTLVSADNEQQRIDLQKQIYGAEIKQMQDNSLIQKLHALSTVPDTLSKTGIKVTPDMISNMAQSLFNPDEKQKMAGIVGSLSNLQEKMVRVPNSKGGYDVMPASEMAPGSVEAAALKGQYSVQNTLAREQSKYDIAKMNNETKLQMAQDHLTFMRDVQGAKGDSEKAKLTRAYISKLTMAGMDPIDAANKVNEAVGMTSEPTQTSPESTLSPGTKGGILGIGSKPAITMNDLIKSVGQSNAKKYENSLGAPLDKVLNNSLNVINSKQDRSDKIKTAIQHLQYIKQKAPGLYSKISEGYLSQFDFNHDELKKINELVK